MEDVHLRSGGRQEPALQPERLQPGATAVRVQHEAPRITRIR